MSGSVVDVWTSVLTLLNALGYDAGEPASVGEAGQQCSLLGLVWTNASLDAPHMHFRQTFFIHIDAQAIAPQRQVPHMHFSQTISMHID